MKELLLPAESKMIVDFGLSVVFALLMGIELNNRLEEDERPKVFGTDRTFAFITTLGYILWIVTPYDHQPYLLGFGAITTLLGIYYFARAKNESRYGSTAIVLALVMYALPPLVVTQPRWFSLLVIVIVMTLSEIKPQIKAFSSKLLGSEFLTLSKFLIMTGVILPLVPDTVVIPIVEISPHKLWLAIVVISSISYVSYIIRKFLLPNAGLVISGIFGGLYSSTATIFILARKSKDSPASPFEYTAAILAANTMLFLRIWIIIFIFNPSLAMHTLPEFAVMTLTGAAMTIMMSRRTKETAVTTPSSGIIDSNPLELKVAVIFAALYMIFAFITSYTVTNFGSAGLTVLSYVVGLSDINPFIINLFQTHTSGLTQQVIASATINAVAGNTLLHGVYSLTLCSKELRKPLITGYIVLGIAVVGASVVVSMGW